MLCLHELIDFFLKDYTVQLHFVALFLLYHSPCLIWFSKLHCEKLFSMKALLFMAFLVLGLVEEMLPHVLQKCGIVDLVTQQCLQYRLGLEQLQQCPLGGLRWPHVMLPRVPTGTRSIALPVYRGSAANTYRQQSTGDWLNQAQFLIPHWGFSVTQPALLSSPLHSKSRFLSTEIFLPFKVSTFQFPIAHTKKEKASMHTKKTKLQYKKNL